jgi:hypothetical protein
MNYEKPELVALGSASESIQSNNMKGPGVLETQAPFKRTIGAYVADE